MFELLLLLPLLATAFYFVLDSNDAPTSDPDDDHATMNNTDGDGDGHIHGTPRADTINGGGGNDILHGWDGNDTLNGDDGVDRVISVDGDDVLNGGTGYDTLYGGAGADLYRSRAGGGGDMTTKGDFDPSEDRLELDLARSDLVTAPYGITFEDWMDGTGADVVVNGVTFAHVHGA